MSVIDFDIKCVRCGATLQGAALDGACANCGSPIGAMLHVPAIDAEAMTVAQDVFCVRCDYNLRTLPVATVCPECGSPVAPSLRPTLLSFAPPDWLAEQRTMAAVVPGCLLLPLVMVGLIPFAQGTIGSLVLVVLTILVLPTPLGLLVGLCLLAAPVRDHPHLKLIGQLPLYCLILLFAGVLFVCLGISLLFFSSAALLCVGAGLCCGIGLFLCVARSIEYKAERTDSRRLRTLARMWSWTLTALIVFVPLWLLVFAESLDWPVPRAGLRLAVNVVVAILLIAAYALSLATLIVYRSTLSAILKRQGGGISPASLNSSQGEESSTESR